jgi:hypothetical protein
MLLGNNNSAQQKQNCFVWKHFLVPQPYVAETSASDWKVMRREMAQAYRRDKIRTLSPMAWNIARLQCWH